MGIVSRVKSLQRKPVAELVEKRLNEFESFEGKGEEEWFSELCFCILTANSKAETAIEVQKRLGQKGFLEEREAGVRDCIRAVGHRFHNNKAGFIVEARKHCCSGAGAGRQTGVKGVVQEAKGQARGKGIVQGTKRQALVKGVKGTVQGIVKEEGEEAAREWLVENVKGLGYKEASHFLRNVGYKQLAILDRHILRLLEEDGFIEEVPKSLGRKRYLEIEKKFEGIAGKIGMTAAELDLYMWYMKTGKVLK